MINKYIVVTCTALGASKPNGGFGSIEDARAWAESHEDKIDSYSIYTQTTSLVEQVARSVSMDGDCIFKRLG